MALLVALGLTFGVKAGLDARQQIPPQMVKAPAAYGTVTGTLVVAGERSALRWQLVVHGLTGAARTLELHRGKLGRRGPRIVRLCAPCRPGAHGSLHLSASTAATIRAGAVYVVVTTRKNPAGEIRGQLRVLGGA